MIGVDCGYSERKAKLMGCLGMGGVGASGPSKGTFDCICNELGGPRVFIHERVRWNGLTAQADRAFYV